MVEEIKFLKKDCSNYNFAGLGLDIDSKTNRLIFIKISETSEKLLCSLNYYRNNLSSAIATNSSNYPISIELE